jgi:hypothetical protein
MTSFSTIKTNTYDGSNQARQRDSCCPDPCNIWHPHCPFCVFFICIDRCCSFLAHAGGPRVSNPSVVDCELCRVLPNIPRHLLAEVRRPLTAGRSRTTGRPPVISDAWFRVGTGAFSPAFFFLCPQHRAKKKVSVRAASRGRMPACRATDRVTCSALDGESCWSGDRVWSVDADRKQGEKLLAHAHSRTVSSIRRAQQQGRAAYVPHRCQSEKTTSLSDGFHLHHGIRFTDKADY